MSRCIATHGLGIWISTNMAISLCIIVCRYMLTFKTILFITNFRMTIMTFLARVRNYTYTCIVTFFKFGNLFPYFSNLTYELMTWNQRKSCSAHKIKTEFEIWMTNAAVMNIHFDIKISYFGFVNPKWCNFWSYICQTPRDIPIFIFPTLLNWLVFCWC